MNIFGKNQKLWFAGDFDPTQATNVNLSALKQLGAGGSFATQPAAYRFRFQQPCACPISRWFRPAHQRNGLAHAGTPRISCSVPVTGTEDFSVFKYFNIVERVRVRFTADFFNVFNHPVDYLAGSGQQDLNKNTGLLDLSRQVNDPRIIQFSLRLEF